MKRKSAILAFFVGACTIFGVLWMLEKTAHAQSHINPVTIVNPDIIPGQPLEHPVVFVSRNRMPSWRHVHVGPPLDVQARELTPGGKLLLRNIDGSITDLTNGTELYDVQQPDVSMDGMKIAFSAVTGPNGQWHIWQMNIDGTGLEQLTFGDRDIPIPEDPRNPKRNERVFSRYGDFGPVWLPDGRILFSSTRYMTLSGSCGERGQNLYVLDTKTKRFSRRTTERAGGMDPFVLKDGRIAFSHWIDTTNRPKNHGQGLEPLKEAYSYGPNRWGIWVMNPDATDAHRYLFTFGNFEDGGGLFQPHELSNGNIVVAARAASSLLGDTLAGGVAIIPPGPRDPHGLKVLGDPFVNEGPHALCPAPLPDERIIVAYTDDATVLTDQNGIRSADYDFGLYVTDSAFSSLSLVYNDPLKDELDPVAVTSRTLPIIPDIPEADQITDDPAISLGHRATMTNHNVYADVMPHISPLPSPRLGTVAYIDVYNDDQTFTTSDQFPKLTKQMPELVGRFPVAADGSFSIHVPADEPLLFVLTDRLGVAVRSPVSIRRSLGTGLSITHTFNGHDYLRPNTEISCSGCHKGHMFDAHAAQKARVNLMQLATATASSEHDHFRTGAWRAIDGYLGEEGGAHAWSTLEGHDSWIQFDWPTAVKVDTITIYPVSMTGCEIIRSTLLLSDGTKFDLGPFPEQEPGLTINLGDLHVITWMRLTVNESVSDLVGIAEVVVNGDEDGLVPPDIPPPGPVNLASTEGVLYLTWQRNQHKTNEPTVAGYRVYYGTSPGNYGHYVDVGNVTSFLMKDLLDDNTTYHMAVKAVNIHGTLSENFSNEARATVHAPEIASIWPDHGRVGGGTFIIIKGKHFYKAGAHVLMGHLHAREVKVVDEKTITGYTPWHAPGPVDVKIINPDNREAVLIRGFNYDPPLNP